MSLVDQQHDVWFDYAKFYDWVATQSAWTRFAELGVWKGASIAHLASRLKGREGVELYAVDLFANTTEGYRNRPGFGETIHEVYDEYLRRCGVRDMVVDVACDTADAADLFPDNHFDFVYIDASHDFDSVCRDIRAWLPKVRSGGMLAGHDFNESGVCEAVNLLLPSACPFSDETCGHRVWVVQL